MIRLCIMPTRIDSEHAMKDSRYNTAAAKVLGRVRSETGLTQGDFTRMLARKLGMSALSQSTLSGWETGNRAMPAAVLMSALDVGKDRRLDVAHIVDDILSRQETVGEDRVRQERVQDALVVLADLLGGQRSPEEMERIRSVVASAAGVESENP